MRFEPISGPIMLAGIKCQAQAGIGTNVAAGLINTAFLTRPGRLRAVLRVKKPPKEFPTINVFSIFNPSSKSAIQSVKSWRWWKLIGRMRTLLFGSLIVSTA